MAGTIGGTTYGVAKNVNLVAVRVLDCGGSGSYTGIIAGINWVVAHRTGPAVINMSLGGPASEALNTAVNGAVANGVVFARRGRQREHRTPARRRRRAPRRADRRRPATAPTRGPAFSNYGSCLDIFAPGVSIASDYFRSDTAVVA